jgi:hypothetical protein
MAVLLPFLLSLDSLLASLALGVLRVDRTRRLRLAVAFGICDAFASLLRSSLGPPTTKSLWLELPQFRLALGVYLLAVFSVWIFRVTRPFGSRLLWTIPILLSIDNLLGAGQAPFTASSVILVAFASASMSLVGFGLATFLADMTRHVTSHWAFLRRSIP